MENQLLPQFETSVEATYELSNLLLSQLARMTQMNMAHTKLMMALAQNQITAGLTAKTPEEVMAHFNETVDAQVKSLTAFGTEMCELGLSFQSEDAQFVESHVSKGDATMQGLFERLATQTWMPQKKS
jgi:methionine-rich copper-binding protein CopC